MDCMNCKTCHNVLPDLLIDPESRPATEARAHIATCVACAEEFSELEATFALLDAWEAPEISPYFDQKLAVRLREEQQVAPAGWFERLSDRLRFGTGRQLRPALAGALALVLVAAGGGVGISTLSHGHSLHVSATVNDLQILDRNEQALQQEDQILQDNTSQDVDQAVPPES